MARRRPPPPPAQPRRQRCARLRARRLGGSEVPLGRLRPTPRRRPASCSLGRPRIRGVRALPTCRRCGCQHQTMLRLSAGCTPGWAGRTRLRASCGLHSMSCTPPRPCGSWQSRGMRRRCGWAATAGPTQTKPACCVGGLPRRWIALPAPHSGARSSSMTRPLTHCCWGARPARPSWRAQPLPPPWLAAPGTRRTAAGPPRSPAGECAPRAPPPRTQPCGWSAWRTRGTATEATSSLRRLQPPCPWGTCCSAWHGRTAARRRLRLRAAASARMRWARSRRRRGSSPWTLSCSWTASSARSRRCCGRCVPAWPTRATPRASCREARCRATRPTTRSCSNRCSPPLFSRRTRPRWTPRGRRQLFGPAPLLRPPPRRLHHRCIRRRPAASTPSRSPAACRTAPMQAGRCWTATWRRRRSRVTRSRVAVWTSPPLRWTRCCAGAACAGAC